MTVLVSVVSVVLNILEPEAKSVPIKMLRLIRVLRLAKLFKQFQAMNRLVTAIYCCLKPMFNAFLILFCITIIYAVIGTEVFSARNPDHFANFHTSLFSLMQMLAGDSWASSIARGMYLPDPVSGAKITEPAVALYFVTFFFIGVVILLNVVVAVLLDEFIVSVVREKEQAEREAEKENAKMRITGFLDTITCQLKTFDSRENLMQRIDKIYQKLDDDDSGGLNFAEFKAGIKSLPGIPRMHMTEADFNDLTDNGRHLNSAGEFGSDQFRDMMKEEFIRYTQRYLANTVKESRSNEYKSSVLQLKVLEMILLDQIQAAALPGPRIPPVLNSSGDGSCSEDLKGLISSAISSAIVDHEKRMLDRISLLDKSLFQILQSGHMNMQGNDLFSNKPRESLPGAVYAETEGSFSRPPLTHTTSSCNVLRPLPKFIGSSIAPLEKGSDSFPSTVLL